jgi:dTDP-4-amino-4,6-dideoxygalactose transaminase
VAREILSLPMHPHITRDEVAAVATAIAAFDGEGRGKTGSREVTLA